MYKRVILNLLVDEQNILQSRRFKRQVFCKLNETIDFLQIDKMCAYCDEISIIYVGKKNDLSNVKSIISEAQLNKLFLPTSLGGNIKTVNQAKQALEIGCDKVIVSTSLINNPEKLKEISLYCGRQSTVLPLQLIYNNNTIDLERWENKGQKRIENISHEKLAKLVNELPIGEVILNDIQADGCGRGYNIDSHKSLVQKLNVPVVVAGGDGKIEDLSLAMQQGIDAVVISNLFAFIGNGIQKARAVAIEKGIRLPLFHD